MCLKSICILGADVTNVKYAIHFVDHNLIVLFIPQKIITSPCLIVGVLEVVWTKFRLVWATELSLHRLRFHRMNLYLEGKFQRGESLDSLIMSISKSDVLFPILFQRSYSTHKKENKVFPIQVLFSIVQPENG